MTDVRADNVTDAIIENTQDTDKPTRVVALIPAYNEAERLGATVTATLAIPEVDEVLVIDDGSTDDTAARAKTAGALVITLSGNHGKGGALEAGADTLQVQSADIILLLDGDLAETASQGALLLAPVLAGEADMSIAKFPRPAGKAGFGLVKGLAHDTIAEFGGGFQAEAPLSGQRALTRECLNVVRPFANGYGVEVALTVRALRAGMRVREVETTMTHAATGRDLAGFIHRGKQYLDVRRTLRQLKK